MRGAPRTSRCRLPRPMGTATTSPRSPHGRNAISDGSMRSAAIDPVATARRAGESRAAYRAIVATDRPAWLPDDDAAAAPARRCIALRGHRDRRARGRSSRRGIAAADRVSDTRARDRACADVRARTRDAESGRPRRDRRRQPARATQRRHRARGGNPVSRAAARTAAGRVAAVWRFAGRAAGCDTDRRLCARPHCARVRARRRDGRRRAAARAVPARCRSAVDATRGRRARVARNRSARCRLVRRRRCASRDRSDASPAFQRRGASHADSAIAARMGARLVRLAECTRLAGDGDAVECAMAGARRVVERRRAIRRHRGGDGRADAGRGARHTARAARRHAVPAGGAAGSRADPRQPRSRRAVVRCGVARRLRRATLAACRVAESVPAASLAICARRSASASRLGAGRRACAHACAVVDRTGDRRQPCGADRRCARRRVTVVRRMAGARHVVAAAGAIGRRHPCRCAGAHRRRSRARTSGRHVRPRRRAALR